MAARGRATYRILFLQKGRWRVKGVNLRYVTQFKIFYGKRLVVKSQPFPSRHKSAQDRRAYLERLIRKIERQRLLILEQRRKARLKRQADDARRREIRRRRRAISRPIEPEVEPEAALLYSRLVSFRKQRPVFEKIKAVKPAPFSVCSLCQRPLFCAVLMRYS